MGRGEGKGRGRRGGSVYRGVREGEGGGEAGKRSERLVPESFQNVPLLSRSL